MSPVRFAFVRQVVESDGTVRTDETSLTERGTCPETTLNAAVPSPEALLTVNYAVPDPADPGRHTLVYALGGHARSLRLRLEDSGSILDPSQVDEPILNWHFFETIIADD